MARQVGKFPYQGSYFECLRSVDAGTVTVSHRRFPAGFREGMHYHSTPYLQAVLAGDLLEGDVAYHVGSVGYQPVGEHSSRVPDGPLETVVIDMGEDVGVTAGSFRSLELSALTTTLLVELRRSDPFSPLAIEGLVHELLGALGVTAVEYSTRPLWLHRAISWIHDSTGGPMTLEAISGEVAVHPATLTRAFRRFFGSSVANYVRDVRVEQARRLVVGSDMPLAMIAAETGFVDQSHLTMWFKRRYHETPHMCRKQVVASASRR